MEEVFTKAIQCLKEEDRCLPFIEKMLPMLQAGIAVHHSGVCGCQLHLPAAVGPLWAIAS